MREVAGRLRISQKCIRFAGIKDTKALTAQHVSLQNVAPRRVFDVQIKDIKLYPKRFSRERMYSQLIKGNRFHITVRDIDQSISVIEERTLNIQQILWVRLGNYRGDFVNFLFKATSPIFSTGF